MELSAHIYENRTTINDYLGNTITPGGISLECSKIEKFLEKIRMPNTMKYIKRLSGFVQFFRYFTSKIGQKLLSFTNHSQNTFTITNNHQVSLNTSKSILTRAMNLTLRSDKPGLQYVIVSDGSFHGTGFVL